MAGGAKPDILVIGAGSAGLSVAAAAAMLKARVVLVERGAMGGDCLNTGCVPSKALIAAAAMAEAPRRAQAFGIRLAGERIDAAGVFGHVAGAIAAIAPHDSRARFESLGVTVVEGTARFLDRRRVAVGERVFAPRRIVIAAGAGPAVPPIPGLKDVRFHTNETIFSLGRIPERLGVIGAGPIGLELGQAFARLGSRVTVLEQAEMLAGTDEDVRAILRGQLAADGLVLREGVRVVAVAAAGEALALSLETAEGGRETLEVDELLVAVGRRPDLSALDLEAGGVALTARGFIKVDGGLRTTNRRVFALGDCIEAPQFTHAAGYAAGVLVRRLMGIPARADFRWIPRVTWTDPQVAGVGISEAEARRRFGEEVEVLTEPFAGLDRAVCDGATDGFAKLVLARGRPVGVVIVGARAGELIAPFVEVLAGRRRLADLAGGVWPYPSYGEISKKLASAVYRRRLENPWTSRLLRARWRLRRPF